MEDIEDLIVSEDYWESTTRLQRETIIPKVRRRNKISNTELAEQLNNGVCDCSSSTSNGTCCNSSSDGTSMGTSNKGHDGSVLLTNNQANSSSDTNEKSSCCNGTDCRSALRDTSKSDSASTCLTSRSSSNKDTDQSGSNIPGLGRVYVRTWGCAHNSSDSEYMAGQLASYGYDIVDKKEEADLWLLNSCTVKSPAEHHLRNEINSAFDLGKKVVVAGCVSQGAPRSEFLAGLSIVGVQQIDRVVEVVEETLRGNSVRLLATKKMGKKRLGGASLQLPKIRRNPLIEIISINTGCLNQCTYCKTKHARGELASYSIEELVARAEQSFEEGVVELWLTSEDTGAYGRDIGTTLPELLRRLVDVVPQGCKLRLGMTNPPYILDHLKEMAEILQHPRVYRFLHVPVQSGSDNVLWDMKREYTREQFCTVADTLKTSVPGLTIATDIICGYPTETDEDFQQTMSLCEHYRFPSLFINQYFPRPGTPAAKLPRIHPKEVKQRTKQLSDFFQSYTPYDHKLGERQTVLVTEESHDKQFWVGHNDFYEQVLVPKDQDFRGKTLQVEIIETGKHYLKGRVLDTEGLASPALADPLPQGAVSGAAEAPFLTVFANIGQISAKCKANGSVLGDCTAASTVNKQGIDKKGELAKQETFIIISFVVIISALLAKLAWVCWRMASL